jgi:hypothetical protein
MPNLAAVFALHLHAQKQNPAHKRNVRTPVPVCAKKNIQTASSRAACGSAF